MEYRLPWQGHLISPSDTSFTWQPLMGLGAAKKAFTPACNGLSDDDHLRRYHDAATDRHVGESDHTGRAGWRRRLCRGVGRSVRGATRRRLVTAAGGRRHRCRRMSRPRHCRPRERPAHTHGTRREEHDPTAHFRRRGIGRGRVWVGHADPPFWVVVTLMATKRGTDWFNARARQLHTIRSMSTADLWSEGAAYERFMGRWSRMGCRRTSLTGSTFPPDCVGAHRVRYRCIDGGGFPSRADPVSIRGTDPSEAFVATAARQVDDPRAQFVVADAATTPSGRVDVVVAGLVVNFLPDPDGALRAAGSAAPGAPSPPMSGTTPTACRCFATSGMWLWPWIRAPRLLTRAVDSPCRTDRLEDPLAPSWPPGR